MVEWQQIGLLRAGGHSDADIAKYLGLSEEFVRSITDREKPGDFPVAEFPERKKNYNGVRKKAHRCSGCGAMVTQLPCLNCKLKKG